MLTDAHNGLPYLELAGTHFDIGVQLGRHGANIVHKHLIRTHAWTTVMDFKRSNRIAVAKSAVEQRFPHYWRELHGLAVGLGLPFDDVFAWNCRGDVWAMAPDGCTTVQLPGREPIIAHNEDGDPGLRGGCAVAKVMPAHGKSFTAFIYPASIPGHTFAINQSGLVQTVNNIRSQDSGDGLPRMVLTRAVLDCETVETAVKLISGAQRAGAFHLTLADANDARILSVEFTHSNCSVHQIAEPCVHANHLIHSETALERQIVTGSSHSRQVRGDEILKSTSGTIDPLSILWDQERAALPVYRAQPDDPDDENTLATAVFKIGKDKVEWGVYDRANEPARFLLQETLTTSA
jgi:predicted choloylglycine hydrolase